MNPDDTILDEAAKQIRAGEYRIALALLDAPCASDAPHWNALYLAGQCRRFLNDFDGAISLLLHASAAAPKEAPVFLALGIALQLGGRLDDACQALARAIEIDPDYALAFNSLAMTQKLAGKLDKAVDNYDAGCKALARKIVGALRNDRANPILKHRDTCGTLWLEHALYGALHLVAMQEGLSGMATPEGELAAEEEQTERHGGLYWEDIVDGNGDSVRLFLPNYFNTFRETLRRDSTYSSLIGNRSTVLQLMGRHIEARDHRDEASEFMPFAG